MLVVGGIVIHEEDVWHLQQRLDSFLFRKLRALGHDHIEFELHGSEIWRGGKNWDKISQHDRRRILNGAFGAIAGYSPVNPELPWRLIGTVIERRDPASQKLRAYELITKKFDDFVFRISSRGLQQRGLIIHDQSSIEGTLQNWTQQWRVASNSLGPLQNLADVPLFADSRATRALQVADLIAYALYKYYAQPRPMSKGAPGERYMRHLWQQFDAEDGHMHGLIHDCSHYRRCNCPACTSRR